MFLLIDLHTFLSEQDLKLWQKKLKNMRVKGKSDGCSRANVLNVRKTGEIVKMQTLSKRDLMCGIVRGESCTDLGSGW